MILNVTGLKKYALSISGESLISIFVFLIGIIVLQAIIIVYGNIKQRKDNKERKTIMETMKEFWPKIIFYLFATSIISIFTMAMIFDKNVTLNSLNNWIGIVLGFSSWIVSIISLFLSFYTVDKSITRMENIDSSIKSSVQSIKGNGWTQDYIDWCYLKEGQRVVNEFKKSGNGVFYLGKYGYIVRDSIINIDGNKYYFDENGKMAVNEIKENKDGKKMFFTADGTALDNGEIVIEHIKYIIKDYYVVNEQEI